MIFYPSASMSCCSDDLAQLLPSLDLWSLGSENISEIFASTRPLFYTPSIPTHIQERREREQQDLELAKEMAEEDEEEDFP